MNFVDAATTELISADLSPHIGGFDDFLQFTG